VAPNWSPDIVKNVLRNTKTN